MMEKIKVLIVDDSPFSQMMVKKALPDECEICACAGTGREGLELYRSLHPDLVTMDVTMPDMDGFVCSQEILLFDPKAKIVILSAMKDESLVARGRSLGIRAFIQKPIKAAELEETIIALCSNGYHKVELLEKYFEHFTDCLKEVLWDMAQIECLKSTVSTQGSRFSSQGLAVIIGITGLRQGRLILDFSWSTALVFAQKVYGKADLSDEEVLNSVAEFANIVCGHGVSKLNNSFKMELRVAPPSILFGDTLNIVNPKLKASLASIETTIGQLNLSVGFLGGK